MEEANSYRPTGFAMNILHKTLPSLALVMALAAPAAAQDVAASDTSNDGPDMTTSVYRDWTLRCQKAETGPAPLCEITQSLQQQENKQFIARLVVGTPQETDETHLLAQLPAGVWLQAAPKLRLEGGLDIDLTYTRCQQVCAATTSLSEAELDALRASTSPATLVFRIQAEQDLEFPISLQGFDQALAATH
ncbi:invasion associated locus B family protein [Tritonibacter scottomollicae]|nr:invasion associated locus B family protein [Tritonibacter scottomollicae]